ncbi:MAG: hypothetical protein KA479_04480 [Saprospiraceae bacterium]|nr:hypothetical protein [Saprospiraceae bacterium]
MHRSRLRKIRKLLSELSQSLTLSVLKIPMWLAMITLLAILFEIGLAIPSSSLPISVPLFARLTMFAGIISLGRKYYLVVERPPFKVWFFDGGYVLFLLLIMILGVPDAVNTIIYRMGMYLGVVLVFIREFSTIRIVFKRRYLNPAQLFISSFFILVLLGTMLLMLPNATGSGIRFIDALFTSTSAVCVTGLAVVDTGTHFTLLGQSILILLMQVGGIGIMTFTSYFAYFFRGSSSYENHLVLNDMTNTKEISQAFSTLYKIILLTFLIEGIGGVLIYLSLDQKLIPIWGDRVFFSLFHAVSGFCNAGFSTLKNGLYETGYRHNYSLQLITAFLLILGGIGFSILFNLWKYVKYLVINSFIAIKTGNKRVHRPWVITINSRIVIITSLILLISGTFLFYIFEYNNTLAEHSGYGKLVTAFFSAASPRTAGFNAIDMAAMSFPTVMIVIFLMWIGASPGSTGGGIKTSTLAIATLNFISIARGKERLEVFRREIAETSLRRAFAMISLSLIAIGMSVFFITIFDEKQNLLHIAFECFSAFSTVGLSLGITAALSDASKLVLIITMFVGRVSMLTILIAVFRKARQIRYKYPTEEILIN